MKLSSYFFLLVFFVFGWSYVGSAACQNDSFHDERRQRDFEAVQEFVNSKRTIPLEEKDCNLAISGDIRVRWAYIDENVNDHDLRGDKGDANQSGDGLVSSIYEDEVEGGIGYRNNAFDVEFNLYLDYVCDRAWGVAWLQFDNDAGIFDTGLSCGLGDSKTKDSEGLFGSGCCDDLCLRKAYIGYNICTDGCQRLDIEVGRRPLYNVFDSRVQFQSNFDGVLFRYGRSANQWGNFYWNLGLFVVDESSDHYAYVTEIGLLNAWCRKLDVKYSFIDWKSLTGCHEENRCGKKDPLGTNFQVHQWTAAYTHYLECWCCKPLKFYGAFLWNSAGKEYEHLGNKKRNVAWYIGAILGQVCQEGDWAVDLNYNYVQANAIPDTDFGGIGANGRNLLGRNHFDSKSTAKGPAQARGLTNFYGISVESLYALTDHLSLSGLLEWTTDQEEVVGGTHNYWKAEFAAIYAF